MNMVFMYFDVVPKVKRKERSFQLALYSNMCISYLASFGSFVVITVITVNVYYLRVRYLNTRTNTMWIM